MYDRKAFKREAKQMLRTSAPHFMLVTLLYYLLTAGLSSLVSWLTNTFSLSYGGGVLSLFLTILVSLFSLVMGVGFTNYSLRLIRGEETGWNSLFHPFSYSGRAMGLPLLTMLYSFLWYLAIFIAAGILQFILFTAAVYSPLLWPMVIVCTLLIYLAALAAFIYLVIRYGMAEYALVDDPGIGPLEAVRRSIRMLRGYKGKFFVLKLSFLGWALLVWLIVLAVTVIGMFASGAVQLLEPLAAAFEALSYSNVIYPTIYTLIDQIIERMILWFLLAELLSLPLRLWLMAYQQTAMARFYNYVGGYDYHQFMNAQRAQTPPPPVWTDPSPNPAPDRPAGPPAGGYYTPQPNVSDPPEIPAPQPPPAQDESIAPAPDAPSEEPDESGGDEEI